MTQLFTKHWFLISLALALAIGSLGAGALEPLAANAALRGGIVAAVLFLMGLPLSPAAIGESVRRPAASLLATALNVVAVPLAAAAVAPLLPVGLGGGLIVAAVVPCTLASASVWTRRGGGDDAVSMLVTVVTNLLCFLVAPAWLLLLVGQVIEIEFADQAQKLAALVVTPLLAAQLLRLHPPIAAWSMRHMKPLGILAQLGILVMVAIGAVHMTERLHGSSDSLSAASLLAMGLLAIAVHLAVLAAGWHLARLLNIGRAQQIAVAIAGSQKTLMIGLQIAIDCGVSVLPMIVYHVGQLVVDTVLVDRWARGKPESEEATS